MFILFNFIGIVANAQINNLEGLVKKNEEAVVLIECFNNDNVLISTGSGVIINKNGEVLTNVHVIKGASSARVKLFDNRYYKIVLVLGYNSLTDLALLKIDTKGAILTQATISTEYCNKGASVFTIGNPDGLENSISTGIVSSVRVMGDYGDSYQITAPISPGSSGGGLFNSKGELVGITTFSKVSSLNQNLNFAICIQNLSTIRSKTYIPFHEAYKEILFNNFIEECNALMKYGQYEDVIKIAQEVYQSDSLNWLALHYMGKALAEIEEYKYSASVLIKSISLNKIDENYKFSSLVTLGVVFRKIGEYNLAKSCYLSAIEINPNDAIVYCNMSVLLASFEKELGADSRLMKSYYKKALELDKYSCAWGYKDMAKEAYSQKDYERAIFLLSLSIEIDKQNDELLAINEYKNRGEIYFTVYKDYEKAIADLDNCIRLSPLTAKCYVSKAFVLIEKGDYVQACAIFNKATELISKFGGDSDLIEVTNFYKGKYCK
jgi:tetratricopeptide (TPR) repeat protein